jgi:cell division protein ZapA
MAQVTVKVNGYTYTVGCEDGQESHLQAMAAQVEDRVDSIKALGGNSGESRLLLMAALLMADEIHDLRVELGQQPDNPGRPAHPDAKPGEKADPDMARRIGRLAARAEEIAASLERP